MGESTDDWKVECSDEDSYPEVKPSKEWEPNGQQIAMLYRQLEKIGSIDLKWQCPGRRSPSVHSSSLGMDKKMTDANEQSKKTIEPNEFDFDDDFMDEPTMNKVTVPRRKSTTQSRCFLTVFNREFY